MTQPSYYVPISIALVEISNLQPQERIYLNPDPNSLLIIAKINGNDYEVDKQVGLVYHPNKTIYDYNGLEQMILALQLTQILFKKITKP